MKTFRKFKLMLGCMAFFLMILISAGNSAKGGECIIGAADQGGCDGMAVNEYCSNCNIGVSVCAGYSYCGCSWYGLYECAGLYDPAYPADQ
jgi:hypothetical protein